MLDIAIEKFKYMNNVLFEIVDVENTIINERYNNIILYSMFPHLKNKTETIKLLVDNNLT